MQLCCSSVLLQVASSKASKLQGAHTGCSKASKLQLCCSSVAALLQLCSVAALSSKASKLQVAHTGSSKASKLQACSKASKVQVAPTAAILACASYDLNKALTLEAALQSVLTLLALLVQQCKHGRSESALQSEVN